MVQQMLKRVIQWLKKLFQGLFARKHSPKPVQQNIEKTTAPPLSDTDLEFLFTELLAGVHQARGQAWAQNWLHKIEHRVSTQQWLDWLNHFGERLLASTKPHNELAARLVQLGELEVGEVGDLAYNIGMQLLTRTQAEPIWEYDGPDAVSPTVSEENFPEEEYQTVTWDELLVILQENDILRQQIVQDFAIESDDPQQIIQVLINKSQTMGESAGSEKSDQPIPE
ncbi:hypothetical protein H6F47_26925 [Sphaerospermopsis sp. FACHB-1094]|uniref:hypothetical protein n=1 Tax=Sphaerospermopsis sp. FACHB-1094 TaxID=2692861 RepID=UPI001683DAC4|nr:hypothetical protein [Sphaerospermopsis sp. FACHB-1094]MBD2135934.1 hypothetical protein [Sphaerospermopsis sp. FACHB-1094]